jgi:hypothetical protein
MIYVFACLSPQCITTQRAVKVYRTLIKHKNPFVKFANDNEIEFISEASESELFKKGLVKLEASAEEEKAGETKIEKDIQLKLSQHLIINEPEDLETSQIYIKESKRLKNKQGG